MEKLDKVFSFNNTHELIMSIKSALDIPSFQQIFLLVGVFFYLVTSLVISFFFNNLSSPLVSTTYLNILANSGPAVQIVNKLIDRVNTLFYWTGLSSGCLEALVCGAGRSMGTDFPKISDNLRTTVNRIASSTMGNQTDRYTRLLLDAMVGQGECQERTIFDCPAISSSGQPTLTTDHGTKVAGVLTQTIYFKTISGIAFIASASFVGILTLFIGGVLLVILKRKPRRYRQLIQSNPFYEQHIVAEKLFSMVKNLNGLVTYKSC